ncbi:rhomboid family intramembrane serine protease [Cellulophaga baltica]|uniref:rhomboid family intramembrane serine protease n=1 Tax=Cellulophaga TaxID=104264 RepID=UPI001C06D8CA|nr:MULTISPECIES: rhomboid family intramembrane serine protease [Cellulophaga]MBU2997074.1 rhomboid family intramembrane serine protease [Cellulophaga baltica]MDO6768472.1 rhomboid family intramembrane serine protease [Cellulophaga sp. 1_MG-2023]
MTDSTQFRFSNKVIIVPIVLVLIIWTVFLVEIRFGVNFNKYGIYPRTLIGLRGVLFSPFIHGSAEHLYNNTIPLAVLTSSLIYFYREIAFKVLVYGVLLSGVITWAIGRESYHIGASGLIYVLASFIFFKGIFTKHYRLVALSLIVVFIYGSMLWYIFPIKKGISWEGHLGGFLTGVIFALLYKVKLSHQKKYEWERDDYNEENDEFLQHFDENGNFIEKEADPVIDENSEIKYTYHYVENKEKE